MVSWISILVKKQAQEKLLSFLRNIAGYGGARRSQFFREGASMTYAPEIVNKVWTMASRIGYSDYFVNQDVAAITDDHIYVNQLAKIPMIDIVHYQAGIGFFGDYHHTQKDNMTIINKETLKAVGATLLHVIYYEEL